MSKQQKLPGSLASSRWLISHTLDLLPPLALASLLACLNRLVALGIYLLAGVGLVQVIGLELPGPSSRVPIGLLIVAIIFAGLLKGGLRYAEQYVGHKVAFLALSRLRSTMYEAFAKQAPFAAATKSSGSLLAKATRDIDKVEVFFAHTLPPAVAAVVVSATVSWWTYLNFGSTPALILLSGYVIVGLLLPMIGVPTLRRAASSAATSRGKQNQLVMESLAGVEVLHAFGAGEQMIKRLATTASADAAQGNKAGWVTGLRAALSQIVTWGSALALVLASETTLSATIILVVIAVPSYDSVRTVDGFVLGLQDSLASARRLFATASAPPVVAEQRGSVPLPHTGTLSVQNLSVFHDQRQVVEGVDFSISPGELLTVVGASGSGKSSIAAALVRALKSNGTLSLGEVQLDMVPLAELRSRIVLVSQEAVMVRGSIRENLVLGAEGITDEELRSVINELGLGPWLRAQRDGLDTRLADRSSSLSGGQRQRLALARALVRHPAVLIMDESTSALDADSEQLVLNAINERRGYGMGVLMISHRLATVREANTVMVLDAGKIVESGTPQALLADTSGVFYSMVVRENDRITAESP